MFTVTFSLKIVNGVRLAAWLSSNKNGFFVRPVFNFLSRDFLTKELNNSSFFFKNVKSVVFWNVPQYSSWMYDEYDDSQNASSNSSIACQLRKSYSAYSVKRGIYIFEFVVVAFSKFLYLCQLSVLAQYEDQ